MEKKFEKKTGQTLSIKQELTAEFEHQEDDSGWEVISVSDWVYEPDKLVQNQRRDILEIEEQQNPHIDHILTKADYEELAWSVRSIVYRLLHKTNKDYEELASSVMSILDPLVHKTIEKMKSATDVLEEILKPIIDEEKGISWPPRDSNALTLMEKEIIQREKEGQLDEGFLSEVNAQIRQAKEDGDKPGLEAMLQKVLQLYASVILSKQSYAKKGGEVIKAEQFLESIIKAPKEEWITLLIKGLTVGNGDIPPDEFYGVIKKRIERTLIQTEGGSYQQRILIEYLKVIQLRAKEVVQVLLQRKKQMELLIIQQT